jgi:hypothetical protein
LIGAAELSEERVNNLGREIIGSLDTLIDAEQDLQKNVAKYKYVRSKIMDEFHRVIVPNQMEAKEKMRGIHNAQTKAHVEEKIKGSIAGYERIENQIKTVNPHFVFLKQLLSTFYI